MFKIPSVKFLWDAFDEKFMASTSRRPVVAGAESLWQVTQSEYGWPWAPKEIKMMPANRAKPNITSSLAI